MPVKPEPRDLPDDTELTQFGEMGAMGAEFRNRTRPERGEIDMSLILGRVDAATASKAVRRISVANAIVRYSTAGTFRAKGFTVTHTPTPKRANHVSVFPPMIGDKLAEWDNDMAKLFDSCFTG